MAVEKKTAPYGSWESPITGDLLASSSVGLSWLHLDGEDVYWVEQRPTENGRYVVVRRTPEDSSEDVTPEGINVRTLVHEYGGGMYFVQNGVVIFANFADQRLYRQEAGSDEMQAITPEPEIERGLRYADMRLTPDGEHIVCVRERHREGAEAINELVMLPADGSAEPVVIATGRDFYAAPRISPDGSRLAWLCWDHPNMPWDGCELWVADLVEGALHAEKLVAGGPQESIFQPQWSPEGVLHFVSDRTGWWNIYRVTDGEVENVTPLDAEFGQPHWVFDLSRYDFLPGGRIAAFYSQDGFDHLVMVGADGTMQALDTPFDVLGSLRARDGKVWFFGANAAQGTTLACYHLDSGEVETIKKSEKVEIDPAYFSKPQSIEYPTEDGEVAYALYYPPTNPDYTAPEGEKPPLLVISHGGPTSATRPQLSLSINFWTSRGFAVVDVNYRGSSGYGRPYRTALNGRWGVVDVDDCINAAKYLDERGEIDGDRVAVRGGSAGGYTTLSALTFRDYFAAGASYFGLAELETFVYDTHKFESRYLEGLIGRYPEEKALYYERSPVNSADNLSCPVILLQGLEDKVVPPSQAEIMVEALEKKGLPYAYIGYEGEQHGFRIAKNIKNAAESELYFYGKVFGFEPAGDIEPVDIKNADAL